MTECLVEWIWIVKSTVECLKLDGASRSARGPHRRAALAMRYASARAARDFGKSAAENSDQTPPKTAANLPSARKK